MDGAFNGQILVEKLTKLNSSQQSIETLSHWCIFHRKKAKQVVETWDKQFHCSPREQRVSFLYLANDILQNSRRKGFEFVGEFWKVLPDALNDVFKNGDEFGRNTVLRLVGIWEERKVFGSRGQILKEELLGRNLENRTRDGKAVNYKLKQSSGDILDKLITSYKNVNDGPVDEDVLFARCQSTINLIEKVEKEVEGDLGNLGASGVEELQGQHHILRECIQQLMAVESSRTTLASLLNEAIREQETKIERIHDQLQIAQSRFENIGNVCQHLLNCNSGQIPPEQGPKETLLKSSNDPSFVTEAQASAGEEQLTPIRYHQGHFSENSPRTEEEHRKLEAAAVAAKLTASTSSAQMLTFALSSLASECGISQSAKEDYSSDIKRPKLENGTSPYILPHQPPPPPFPHPDSLHQPPPPPLPPSSSMMQPNQSVQTPLPLQLTMPAMSPPATQFMQTAGPLTSMSYTYSLNLPAQRPPPVPGYPMNGMPPYPGPPSPYRNFQASEGLYNLPPLPATPSSISRQ